MRRSWLFIAAFALAIAGLPALAAAQSLAATGARQARSHPARALLVCNGSTTPCPPGVAHYTTVQAAVNAGRPGDWVLIWPGVYHEKSQAWPVAGVWVATSGIHIRGLDRNRVIIDGSNGSASHPCPASPKVQDYNSGRGRNGVEVWKASGVTIQNLTVCDYLSGAGGAGGGFPVNGNEIWWNGGDGSGTIGLGAYQGSYLTATSMYGPSVSAPHLAQYGIFVSNARGPGLITHSYASNMADAAYYVGACRRECNTLLALDRGTNSMLGYSGTNAGGHLVVRDSVFDHNRTGLAPNSLNNSDAPPPQDGRCPGSAARSCLVIEHNLIVADNNPNVPTTPLKTAIGTGVQIIGGAFDTVRANFIADQGAWGVVTHDYPDLENPPPGSHCQGGIQVSPGECLFTAHGNLVYGNVFKRDGFFGNVTNGDLATAGLLRRSATPRNCFFGNAAVGGKLSSSPAHIERPSVDGPPCDRPGTSINNALIGQLICATGATGLGPCPPGSHYPKSATIVMATLPHLPTMPDPCAGVPRNGFCRHQ